MPSSRQSSTAFLTLTPAPSAAAHRPLPLHPRRSSPSPSPHVLPIRAVTSHSRRNAPTAPGQAPTDTNNRHGAALTTNPSAVHTASPPRAERAPATSEARKRYLSRLRESLHEDRAHCSALNSCFPPCNHVCSANTDPVASSSAPVPTLAHRPSSSAPSHSSPRPAYTRALSAASAFAPAPRRAPAGPSVPANAQAAAGGSRLWRAMQEEARVAAAEEPLLASFLFATVLNHATLQSALAFLLANKLASGAVPATQLMALFTEVMRSADTVVPPVRDAGDDSSSGGDAPLPLCCAYERTLEEDLLAVMERDPACTRFIDCLLYYKGFHALQAHRLAHVLWCASRAPMAYHVQAQVSKELQVDMHPAARIGSGAFFDHATGVVIGETCVIGRNVSMLHHVTLGGSGKKHGVRHPAIGDGVLIGAGATLLGDIRVGDYAQIGACSLVLEDVPASATVVGVPAKVVGRGDAKGVAKKVVPALDMKHERCLGRQAGDENGVEEVGVEELLEQEKREKVKQVRITSLAAESGGAVGESDGAGPGVTVDRYINMEPAVVADAQEVGRGDCGQL